MTTKENTVKTVDITGLSKDPAMTKLIQGGMTFKEAEAYWKENGSGGRASGKGSFTDVLQFLEDKPRTQADLYQYVIDNGTKNEARWIGARDQVRKLTIAIYIKAGVKFTEKGATDEQKKAIKEMVAAK